MDNKKLTSRELIDEFTKQHQFRYSKHTLRSYIYSLESFFEFCNKEYTEIKLKDIRAWEDSLNSDSKAPATIETRLSALKVFFNYLYEDDYMKNNLSEKIKLPKVDLGILKYLEEEELIKLKNIVKDSKRYSALVELLYATGIRSGEAANLRKEDIDLDLKLICVKEGKGNNERIIPFTNECKERLYEYFKERNDDDPHAFLNNLGGPITAQVIRRKFEKFSKKLGKRVYPHILRHTFAAHLARKEAPLFFIQMLLGHKSIHTTLIYARLHNHAISKNYDYYMN